MSLIIRMASYHISISYKVRADAVLTEFFYNDTQKAFAETRIIREKLRLEFLGTSSIRCQFHQHFTCSFFVRTSFRQIFYSYIWLGTKISYKKRARLTLMKLTPGVNFINILRTAFLCADLKSAKKTFKLSVLLHFWDLRA